MTSKIKKYVEAPKISAKYLQDGGAEYQSSKYRSKLATEAAQQMRAVYMAHLLRNEIPESAERILEFGAGFGQNLLKLDLKIKVAYEPTEYAVTHAAYSEDIRFIRSLDEVESDFFDVVLSFHSLEHTVEPYSELLRIRQILKPAGLLILVVPFERNISYRAEDPNYHLYSWNRQTMGNLINEAGFSIKRIRRIYRAGDQRLYFLNKFSTSIWIRATQIYGYLRGFEDILLVGHKPHILPAQTK